MLFRSYRLSICLIVIIHLSNHFRLLIYYVELSEALQVFSRAYLHGFFYLLLPVLGHKYLDLWALIKCQMALFFVTGGRYAPNTSKIGRAHVGTTDPNAQLVCRLLLEKKNINKVKCTSIP